MAFATPVLICAAAATFAAWLVALWREHRPLARTVRAFRRCSSARKAVVLAAAAVALAVGGAKNDRLSAGDADAPVGQGGRLSKSVAVNLRDLPEAETNCMRIAAFEVDRTNMVVSFEMAWDTNAFEGAASRRLDLFASTNLMERPWTLAGGFMMPDAATSHVFAVAQSNVIVAAVQPFLDTFAGRGFYRFGLDVDTDGDTLTDAFESLVALSSPALSDTDGDGLSDSEEISLGTNPSNVDTDGDGIGDFDELGGIRVLPWFEWHDTSGFTRYYGGVSSTNANSHVYTCGELQFDQSVNLAFMPCMGVDFYDMGCFSVYSTYEWFHGANVVPLYNWDLINGNFVVAPYWERGVRLLYGDTNSYMCAGSIADGPVAVVEYHNVMIERPNPDRMTMQAIIPSSTCNVVRVSYLSSDIPLDNPQAMVGFQNNGSASSNHSYCITWDFHERGPIPVGSTLEFHIGTGTNPLASDTDGDGLDDLQESLVVHTSPISIDTDMDSLDDAFELAIGLDPRTQDTDGDGLIDGEELVLGTDPFKHDTDGDGLSDGRELQLGTDPFLLDTDFDGLTDGFEVLTAQTNPCQPDSDGDGMNDGWENACGFDPRIDNSHTSRIDDNADADPDNDGLSNYRECEMGLNPFSYDTDGDGVSDSAEIAQSSDPNDESDFGLPNSRILVPFMFGDPSSSHSEKYSLSITPIQGVGSTPSAFSWLNENYGECEMKTAMLKPGWSYHIRLFHAGTNGTGDGFPDFDYLLLTNGVIASTVVLRDPDSLFGIDNTSSTFAGDGKVATISVYEVDCVEICRPDGEEWTSIDVARVILDDEPLRVKIVISPQLESLTQCRAIFGEGVAIRTSGTCLSGATNEIPETATLVSNTNGMSEIHFSLSHDQIVTLGLLPCQDSDGMNEMAVYDVGSIAGSQGSDLSDSTAFLGLGYAMRGMATNEESYQLDLVPPGSRLSLSFIKAAGCERITVAYGNKVSHMRQIMNQADYFYYSGHGNHRFGTLDEYEPYSIGSYWRRDLNCVIFAGCSILDINDYNNNFLLDPANHLASPGKQWESKGPEVMLGYNYYAPLDETGAPAMIISDWLARRPEYGDVDSWMRANDNKYGHNACAIEKNTRYLYFKKKRFHVHAIKEVPKCEW